MSELCEQQLDIIKVFATSFSYTVGVLKTTILYIVGGKIPYQLKMKKLLSGILKYFIRTDTIMAEFSKSYQSFKDHLSNYIKISSNCPMILNFSQQVDMVVKSSDNQINIYSSYCNLFSRIYKILTCNIGNLNQPNRRNKIRYNNRVIERNISRQMHAIRKLINNH